MSASSSALKRRLERRGGRGGNYDDLVGTGQIDDAVLVDQSPIGRTPRSNPVTYLKAFDEIRNVFAPWLDLAASLRGQDQLRGVAVEASASSRAAAPPRLARAAGSRLGRAGRKADRASPSR